MEDVKVIVKEPGKAPAELVIPNELRAFRRLVSGYIEPVRIASDMIALVDEEGLINDAVYNCRLAGHQLFGPIVFVGVDGDEFCDVPVGLKEIGYLLEGGRIR